MRNSPSMRGFNRTTQYPNTQGSDRSERPVSSFAREGREEGSAVEGDGSFVPGGGSFRAVGGGQRRIASEIASSHRYSPIFAVNITQKFIRTKIRFLVSQASMQ